MNTPITTAELEPAEQRRRATARAKATKLVRSLGFRQVAARPGWWFHPEIDASRLFHFTGDLPIEDVAEVIAHVHFDGLKTGSEHIRRKLREALGL